MQRKTIQGMDIVLIFGLAGCCATRAEPPDFLQILSKEYEGRTSIPGLQRHIIVLWGPRTDSDVNQVRRILTDRTADAFSLWAALSYLEETGGVPEELRCVVLPYLRHRNREIRWKAYEALLCTATRPECNLIVDALRGVNPEDEPLLEEILENLDRSFSKCETSEKAAIVDVLREYLPNVSSRLKAGVIIDILLKIKTTEARSLIRRLTKDGDAQVRRAAKRVLERQNKD